MRASELIIENEDPAAELKRRFGWYMGPIEGTSGFAFQGWKYLFYGDRITIRRPPKYRDPKLPHDGLATSVVWGKPSNWAGRPGEMSFDQAVKAGWLAFDLPIWQALNSGQITNRQALQQIADNNDREIQDYLSRNTPR